MGVKNQMLLLLSEKNSQVDKFFAEAQSILSGASVASGAKPNRRGAVPPPPPMAVGMGLGGQTIHLRGKLLSPIATDVLKNLVDKTIKAIRLNTIRTVDITSVQLEKPQIIELTDSLANNQTVVLLNCAKTKWGALGITALSRSLQVNEALTSLNLSDTSLTTECVTSLSTMLKRNETLKVLDLSHNPMSENDTLSSLNLFNCGITSEGAKNIVEGVSVHD